MRKFLGIILVLCIVVPFSSWANQIKIGYINVFDVFDNYEKTLEYDKNLEKEKSKQEETLIKQKEQIEKMQSGLSLLKESEKEKKGNEIEKAINDFRVLEKEVYDNIKKQRDEKMQEILEDMNVVVGEYAKNNEFDFIINETAVLYGNKVMNITQDILKLMNERYKK